MVGVVYVSWHCYGPAEVLIHPVKCNSWSQGAINLLVAFCRVLVNMSLASISMVYHRACSICMEWSIVLGFFQWYPRLALGFFLLGRVVQSCVKITQGKCKMWIPIWKLKKHFSFISFRLQVDDGKI